MKAMVNFFLASVNFTDYSAAAQTLGDTEECSYERACAGDRRPGAGRRMAGLLLDRGVRCVPSYRRETTVLSTFGSPPPRWPPGICARSGTSSRAPVTTEPSAQPQRPVSGKATLRLRVPAGGVVSARGMGCRCRRAATRSSRGTARVFLRELLAGHDA